MENELEKLLKENEVDLNYRPERAGLTWFGFLDSKEYRFSLFKKENKEYHAKCPRCENEVTEPHLTRFYCSCGYSFNAVSSRCEGRSYVRYVGFFQKIKNGILYRVFAVTYCYTFAQKRVERTISQNEVSNIFYIKGRRAKVFTRMRSNMGYHYDSFNFQKRSKLTKLHIADCNFDDGMLFDLIDDYGENTPMVVDILSKYPALLKIYKAGFDKMLLDISTGCLNCVKYRQKKLSDILDFEVSKIPVDKRKQFSITDYHNFKNALKIFSANEYKYINYCGSEVVNGLTRLGLNAKETIKYLHKQRLYSAIAYFDYIKEITKLNYDLTDKAVLFPPDFSNAHERTSGLCRDMIDNLKKDGFVKATKKWCKYNIESENFSIKCISDIKSLKEKSQVMKNCSAGYVDKIVDKRSVIFWGYSKEPDKEELFMLELSASKKLIQLRGVKNKDVSEETKNKVNQWLKNLVRARNKKIAS